jgi:hypothetical protein
VQGPGSLGPYAMAIATERNARVLAIDGFPARLRQARKFGADHLPDMCQLETPSQRVRAVYDLTGRLRSRRGNGRNRSARGIRRRGTDGAAGRTSCVDRKRNALRDGAIRSESIDGLWDHNHRPVRYELHYLLEVLRFLERNMERFPFASMPDAEFLLEEVREALDKSRRREITRASIIC